MIWRVRIGGGGGKGGRGQRDLRVWEEGEMSALRLGIRFGGLYGYIDSIKLGSAPMWEGAGLPSLDSDGKLYHVSKIQHASSSSPPTT